MTPRRTRRTAWPWLAPWGSRVALTEPVLVTPDYLAAVDALDAPVDPPAATRCSACAARQAQALRRLRAWAWPSLLAALDDPAYLADWAAYDAARRTPCPHTGGMRRD